LTKIEAKIQWHLISGHTVYTEVVCQCSHGKIWGCTDSS